MNIICGPEYDKRVFSLQLPKAKLNLGVFVSGGIDSAILYYALMKLNQEANHTHRIVPYTMMRKEGSRLYAEPVIKYINSLFGKGFYGLNIVGDNTLEEDKQVRSGVLAVYETTNTEVIYVGVIDQLSIHMIGWQPIKTTESTKFRTPLVHLHKSHVIDLVYQLGQEQLFNMTHSCIHEVGKCNNCNGCNERSWAFAQLGKIDTGIV